MVISPGMMFGAVRVERQMEVDEDEMSWFNVVTIAIYVATAIVFDLVRRRATNFGRSSRQQLIAAAGAATLGTIGIAWWIYRPRLEIVVDVVIAACIIVVVVATLVNIWFATK